jgi:GNAT superfamily N-acetyltransferase
MRANFEAEGLFVPLDEKLVEKSRGYMEKAIRHGNLFVMEDANGIPQAMSMIVGEAEEVAQLGGVYVSPKARGKGLAKPIVTFALKAASDRGFGKVILFTQNPPAMKVYHDLGFQIVSSIILGYPKHT